MLPLSSTLGKSVSSTQGYKYKNGPYQHVFIIFFKMTSSIREISSKIMHGIFVGIEMSFLVLKNRFQVILKKIWICVKKKGIAGSIIVSSIDTEWVLE
jgi:hypothetical protein